MKVAFQGEHGAYSEEAIIAHWGEAAEPLPRPYLPDVFDAVEKGDADLGLVAVENSIEGSVVIAHGRSQAKAVKSAIGLAKETAERGVPQIIREGNYEQTNHS